MEAAPEMMGSAISSLSALSTSQDAFISWMLLPMRPICRTVLVLRRGSSLNVSPRHRRSLARTHDEAALHEMRQGGGHRQKRRRPARRQQTLASVHSLTEISRHRGALRGHRVPRRRDRDK